MVDLSVSHGDSAAEELRRLSSAASPLRLVFSHMPQVYSECATTTEAVKTPYKLPADAVWFSTFLEEQLTSLVAGCSSGIGLALANLVATHHPSHRLVTTAPESISVAVAAALGAFGRLDVLVKNAGYDTEPATDD
ncbi:hypothetical protein F4779DRAFT_615786 [Xylariaceae sp. FL0662B]|nr:hypothetical protein F4779DRAFT_615786 [Xylariaceae sp. FL0662B]